MFHTVEGLGVGLRALLSSRLLGLEGSIDIFGKTDEGRNKLRGKVVGGSRKGGKRESLEESKDLVELWNGGYEMARSMSDFTTNQKDE